MLLGTEERNPTHLIPPFEKHPNTVYIVFPSQLVPGLPSSSQLFGVLLVYFFLPIGLYKVHTFDIIMSLAGATEGQGSLTPSGGETSQNAARQQTVELIATSQNGLSVSTQHRRAR